MKKMVLFGIIILIVIPGIFAQVRLDLAIDIPAIVGITEETGISEIDEGINVFDTVGTLPFPSAMLAYQFELGPISTGIGVKAYSWILESVIWPVIYAEVDLDPIVIHANLGGLGFYWFGIVQPMNGGYSSNILIPDLHVAYKFGDTFRLGLGALAITGIEGMESIIPYTIYLTGRFSILFDGDK